MKQTNNSMFNEFTSRMREWLAGYEFRRLEKAEFKPAAVAVLFLNKADEPHVLLTKRTQRVSTHKGQVSFPGGSVDQSDSSPNATALRETFEETGVEPANIRILGRFDDYITKSGYHVACIVGEILQQQEYSVSTGEVERCIEVPVSMFADKVYASLEEDLIQGQMSPVYHYIFDGEDIWGLTAQVLTDMFDKFKGQ